MTAWLLGFLLLTSHILGAMSAVMALMSSRTSQGAIAWILCLLTFPYVALPLYWVFGRPRFYGYVSAREERDSTMRRVLMRFRPKLSPWLSRPLGGNPTHLDAIERLAMMPVTTGNRAKLLINGEHTFDALFHAIDAAEDYILIQFFIVRNDELGVRLKQKLMQRAERGLKEIGCPKLNLQVRASNLEVLKFYQALGYAVEDRASLGKALL